MVATIETVLDVSILYSFSKVIIYSIPDGVTAISVILPPVKITDCEVQVNMFTRYISSSEEIYPCSWAFALTRSRKNRICMSSCFFREYELWFNFTLQNKSFYTTIFSSESLLIKSRLGDCFNHLL